MNQSVVIIGASGHGKVVADIIVKSGDYVVGFLDDNLNLSNTFMEFPVLGSIAQYTQYQDKKFVVAIGNAKIREKIVRKLKNVSWYTAIHPMAVISNMNTNIGEGTVIMANAVINPNASIGNHCIINTGAIVEHDNRLEDYVHISVGAKLAGTVSVGKATWIGIGATVSNNLNICGDCIIGAGTVVVKNIEKAGTYVGVPARRKTLMKKMNNNTEKVSGGSIPSK